jgi:hypothetical protein
MKILIALFTFAFVLTAPAIAGTKPASGSEMPPYYFNQETRASDGAYRYTLYVHPDFQKQAGDEQGPWCQFENHEGPNFGNPVPRTTVIDLTQTKKFYMDWDNDGEAGRLSMKNVGNNLWATDWQTDQPKPGNVHVCWLDGGKEKCAYLYMSPDPAENPTPGFVNGQHVDGLYARKGLTDGQKKAGVKNGDGIIVPVAVSTQAKK